MNDVKGFAAWAIGICRAAVFIRVVARVEAAFAVKMEPDLEHLFASRVVYSPFAKSGGKGRPATVKVSHTTPVVSNWSTIPPAEHQRSTSGWGM